MAILLISISLMLVIINIVFSKFFHSTNKRYYASIRHQALVAFIICSLAPAGGFARPIIRDLTISSDSEIPNIPAEFDKKWKELPLLNALAMHGEPGLPDKFEAFPYVNPGASKGGRLVQSIIGTFDNLNPYTLKGVAAQGITTLVFQPLMARSADEPFSLYPLIANAIRMPADRSCIIFHINPRARFSDGHSITAEDIIFSFNLLRTKGQLFYRNFYEQVSHVKELDPLTVRFDIKGGNRETPLMLAQMPVLPAHLIDSDTFEQETFRIPVGSGPYMISAVDAGRSITFKRNPDFWAKDLPTTRGLYNFDEIRYDYYRDVNTQFEAFKAGLYDVRIEDSAARWATGYNIPAVESGVIVQETLPVGTPRLMYGFALNSRRKALTNIKVREALGYFFDFPWVNRNLYHNLYRRTTSYFAGSSLSSQGVSASSRERELLAPFPDAVRADILEGTWRPPEADGSGRDRTTALKGLQLLTSAGYTLYDGALHDEKGKPLDFEIMVVSRDQERLALNFANSLKAVGITAHVRLVDEAQYWKRLRAADFDVILYTWNVSASPGAEQLGRWSSAAADRPGSLNITGAKSPAIDAMIEALLVAKTLEDYTDAVRALDRVLLSGFYVIPLFHPQGQWIAHNSAIARPERTPLFGPVIDSWWRKH